jgi:4'-phosphopantetheinyl transferase
MSNTPLHDHTLDLWRIDLDNRVPLSQLYPELTRKEQERAARFYFERDRHRYIVGRGMVRTILARYLDSVASRIQLVYGAFGKPSLDPQHHPNTLYFNLSHSDGTGLLGVTQIGEIGVDIEHHRDLSDMMDVARHVFSPWEFTRWASLPPTHRVQAFYRGWTCKEAYMKAVGMGFSLPSNSFDVAFLPDEPTRLISTGATTHPHWYLTVLPLEPTLTSSYALAIKEPSIEIEVRLRNTTELPLR